MRSLIPRRPNRWHTLLATAVIFQAVPVLAQQSGGPPRQVLGTPVPITAETDSAAVAATVEAYHAALATGDTAAAMSLLARNAVILESGGIETREEYRAHHLAADIAFARSVPRERGPLDVRVLGDVAWAASTSVSRGNYRGREIDSQGAELMVLTRTGDRWLIDAIHWSSRNR